MNDELGDIKADMAMMNADMSLVIQYVRTIAQAMGIAELLRLAEEEHKRKSSELSGRNSLWHSNGHERDTERPTDPSPGFSDE
jgi:hypothetical protein